MVDANAKGNTMTTRRIHLLETKRIDASNVDQSIPLDLGSEPALITVDMSGVYEATTPALARLIVVRRALLARGGDLVVTGLSIMTRRWYRLNRLGRMLPCEPAMAQATA